MTSKEASGAPLKKEKRDERKSEMKRVTIQAGLLLVPLTLLLIVAATMHRARHHDLKPTPDKVDTALPNVLLIGDSISIGYTASVRSFLQGKANVYRIPVNAEHSRNILTHLDEWLQGHKWAVIHINSGLHDIKLKGESKQVPLEEYAKNLIAIIAKLKATNAKIIWATTTPVPTGTNKRHAGDEIAYNEQAIRIMHDNGIAIDDLYSTIKHGHAQLQIAQDVHFTAEGYGVLAKAVSESILQTPVFRTLGPVKVSQPAA